MLRYTLTLPTHDNAGNDLTAAHAHIRSRLLRDFDGFTAHEARGHWRGADDTRYAETVVVYTVDAADSDARITGRIMPTPLELLTTLAHQLKVSCEQEAVYLTRQPIDTWLV